MYKLLIVDDEPLIREYLKDHLPSLHERWAFGGEAEDGREALDLLEGGETFDLILTDIKMPVMDGLELARHVFAREIVMRMVILSGYDEFSMAKEAIRYGVQEYLLKPLVPEELAAVLDRTARQLDQVRENRTAYQSLVALSEQSKSQVARNFLRALVSDNNVETKALYPILFRLKISLIEAEGAVMLVASSEGEMLRRSDSPSEIALFRYIVHQTATELTEGSHGGTVFFDGEQRTAVLIAGEDGTDVRARCLAFYRDLASAVWSMTGLNLWGAAGSSEMDVLQLGSSYRKAQQALQFRLFADKPAFYEPDPEDEETAARVRKLEKAAMAAQTAAAERSDAGLAAALRSLIELIDVLSPAKVLDFGTYLLDRLSGWREDPSRSAFEEALLVLKQGASQASASTDDVLALYRRMLKPMYVADDDPQTSAGDEHMIVTKAKNYILGHFAEPLSLALIAEQTGVTPGYLSSLFHRNVQESYIKYLTRVRMEHAAMLLRARPPEKIYDISEKIGYVSVKHFSYVFKQFYGIPPGEYQAKALDS